ncbi:MAG: PadR family transcriptional regulator [Oscillospiraceae bacterium]
MDVQLKRGLLEVCVLAVLLREDSYGYKIIKDVSSCIAISESTLYPILKRLEVAEMLTVYSVEHNSRLRKYYKITQKGIDKILEFKNEWSEIISVYEFISIESGGLKND